MRYIQRTIFLIFLLPVYASAASIDDIAKALVTYFPKVTGKIIAVDKERVIIASENEAGLSEGVLLSAYREGAPFYHPVTHEVLGHFEEEAGEVEVAKVEKGQVTAKALTTAPGAGNFVRLTAARIPIGITAGAAEGDRYLMNELKSALTETGRFVVTATPLYLIMLTSSSHSVKIKMQNVKTGSVIFNIESVLQPSNESDTILESLQYQLLEKQQKGIATK